MKHIALAIAACLVVSAATAQQQPTPQCVYTSVTMPDGKSMTCVTCGSFTSCS